MSVRMLAWQALRSSSGLPLRTLEELAREHELSAVDRGLLRRLVATELRRRGTLRALVRRFGRGRPQRELVPHLHLGLVQLLFFDRVPEHAAVSETVAAARATLSEGPARYANAVLRATLRDRLAGHCGDARRDLVGRPWHFIEPMYADPAEHALLWSEDALSMPAQIMRGWRKRFGPERADELARLALEEPWLSLRVARGERGAQRERLEGSGAQVVEARHTRILLVAPQGAEIALHCDEFRSGELSVQGEGALRAAELLDAREGERVLDLCAAPGGKTAVLAAAGARVLACDVDDGRLARTAGTLERLGLSGRVELRRVAAAEQLPERDFDAVLVDAPCSNTGVLAARPEARWRFGPASQASLAELQHQLLVAGARCVRPGGRLVWSTCSLEPEENERLVRGFVQGHADFALDCESLTLPAPPPGPVDGGYAARLLRRA